MSLCLGKRGKWCIYATYPVFIPKKIRYRYPGGQWQEIVGGDRYMIDQVPAQIAYLYRPHAVTSVVYADGTIAAYLPTINQGNAQFFGEYLGWEWSGPLQGGGFGAHSITIFYRFPPSPGAPVSSVQIFPTPPVWQYGPLANVQSRFLNWLDLRPSNPVEYAPGSCKFTVFSASNQVLLESTTTNCPEVEVIPESCTFPNPELFVRDYINSNISSYIILEPNNSKCVFVNVAIPSDPAIETPPISNLAYLCGDCAAPQIRIDCECDPCFEKRCPRGTVNRILVGNSIQCVDGNHCVTATVPYDPNCETPNCFC